MVHRGEEPPEPEMPAPEDATEWSRIERARHDPTAFAELFDPYWLPILAYCTSRLPTWEDAEEAANDIFLAAARNIGRFTPQGPGSFRSWLFAIARNRVISAGRKRRLTVVPLPAPHSAIGQDWVDPGPTPEAITVAESARSELQEYLNVLTPDQRSVIELRAAGWTTHEIAAFLEFTDDNVRQLESRAMRRMSDEFRRRRGEESRDEC